MQQQPWQTLIKHLLCTKFSSKTHEVGASIIAFYGRGNWPKIMYLGYETGRIWTQELWWLDLTYLVGEADPPHAPPHTHTEKASK